MVCMIEETIKNYNSKEEADIDSKEMEKRDYIWHTGWDTTKGFSVIYRKRNIKSTKTMSDREFIFYLCRQIWNICSDGNEPDIEKIEEELRNRNINPDDIFTY